MTNTSHESARPELLDVLRDDQVREHMVRMFEVGTVLFQESAFAVYDAGQGEHEVSGLYIPDIEDHTGDVTKTASNAESVDIVSIVRHITKLFTMTSDEAINADPEVLKQAFDEYSMFVQGLELSSEAKQKIKSIRAGNDLSQDQAEAMIEKVVERDLGMHISQNIRSDIFLVAHNHPQPPGKKLGSTFEYDAKRLLAPSPSDVSNTNVLLSHNPNLVSMIVAASSKSRQAILYKTRGGQPADVNRYEAEADSGNYKDMVGRLAVAGIDHIIIDLTGSGRLTIPNQNRVKRFAELVK